MGVQPPSDGVDESPDVVEFGIAALAAKLESRDVRFPATADELVGAHGDVAVPVDAAGHEVTLESVLDQCTQREFETDQDLLDALHPIFEAEREATSRSLLAQLRSLVPF
jgi:hypothetical protein